MASAFPESSFTFDSSAISAAYAAVRSKLANDPLFVGDADKYRVSLIELDKRMGKPPRDSTGLWDWLGGPDQYRYAGLMVLCEAAGSGHDAMVVGGNAWVGGAARVMAGDVRVRGDLVLHPQGMLVVLGSLVIDGDLFGDGLDYSVVAARSIRFTSGATGGELIALDGIVATDSVYLARNDYSCRARSIEAKVLVDFERGNAFCEVVAARRVKDWNFEEAAKALSVPYDDDTDLFEAFCKKLQA